MSHTFFVKFHVFKGAFPQNHSLCRPQIFRDNWNCCGLSIFRGFVLLAPSDNDEHVNKAKNVNKDSPMETESSSWMGHPVEIKFNLITLTTTTTTTKSDKNKRTLLSKQ